jgi:hypothetical protein
MTSEPISPVESIVVWLFCISMSVYSDELRQRLGGLLHGDLGERS